MGDTPFGDHARAPRAEVNDKEAPRLMGPFGYELRNAGRIQHRKFCEDCRNLWIRENQGEAGRVFGYCSPTYRGVGG